VKIVPTRRTDYGIRALLYLAGREGQRCKGFEIAEAMGIPKGFLHQVLQALQRAGIVNSMSSRRGGYQLARPAKDITLLEIVESLEASIDTGECALRGGPCHWQDVCALHWVWSSARSSFTECLARATLAQIVADDRGLAEGRKAVPEGAHRHPRRFDREPAIPGMPEP
jgi:Rrf2 family protein